MYMLENFFQLGPIPADQMTGTYNIGLVILSYVVATFASYIALDITGRLRDVSNTQMSITLWLCGGALAMGAGIWSMHFIGMLAFSMNMPMIYSPSWTALSMLVAVAASAFALIILKAKKIRLFRTILGGIVLGFAIAAMHYTGMHAMTTNMNIHYLPGLFALSILIAIVASEAAIYLALKSTQVLPSVRFRLKFVSAFIMGAAICGMHYTGMAAAVFTHKTHADVLAQGLNPELLSISIAAVTIVILSIAFVISTYKESLNQQLLITAKQAGMAEVAASVLHNVGNVLNSINVSSTLVAEKVKNSKLSSLIELKKLLAKHNNNVNDLINNDPNGQHLSKLLTDLAEYWENEQILLTNETQTLIKNVDHVKSIIASQQDLSRIGEFQQMVLIENIMDEAILITGIENSKQGIQVIKNFNKLKPVMIDKVKLLQILVNLIQNAKDAVTGSSNANKKITFKIKSNASHFIIEIEDNGIGIAKENLTRIFAYGFTTKEHGHGFGLHTCAVSAKEMGGSLQVTSAGLNKGATFILELPC